MVKNRSNTHDRLHVVVLVVVVVVVVVVVIGMVGPSVMGDWIDANLIVVVLNVLAVVLS